VTGPPPGSESLAGGRVAEGKLTKLTSGALHINNENVEEDWLDDDQVSAMNTGVNGPGRRAAAVSSESRVPGPGGLASRLARTQA
jgi:hypothetical protein